MNTTRKRHHTIAKRKNAALPFQIPAGGTSSYASAINDSGEIVGHAIGQLWDAGALDVFTSPVDTHLKLRFERNREH